MVPIDVSVSGSSSASAALSSPFSVTGGGGAVASEKGAATGSSWVPWVVLGLSAAVFFFTHLKTKS